MLKEIIHQKITEIDGYLRAGCCKIGKRDGGIFWCSTNHLTLPKNNLEKYKH